MERDAWIALAAVVGVFSLLATTRIAPYLVIMGGVVVLSIAGVLTPSDAFAGFANEGVITVGALFVVVAGLKQTGALAMFVRRVLGYPRTALQAQARLAFPVMTSSAFLNNTPLVAMLVPAVVEWSRTTRIAASLLLIPLSYLAVLGGLCSLIGTSTNLVVNGLLVESGHEGMGLFDITPVGLPVALVGLVFLLIFGRKLLPATRIAAAPAVSESQRSAGGVRFSSRFDGDDPPARKRAPFALMILAGMIAAAGFGWLTMLQAALAAGGLMLATRCCSEQAARHSLDLPLLIAIGSALGLGRALEKTGAAEAIAGNLLAIDGVSPWVALAIIYGITMVLTEMVTNNAAAVIMFPIAMATASQFGVSYLPFVMSLMVAASAGFATPIGYQTHLMVYGAGGYRFMDFVRIGAPMDLLLWAATVAIAPLVWPFS